MDIKNIVNNQKKVLKKVKRLLEKDIENKSQKFTNNSQLQSSDIDDF